MVSQNYDLMFAEGVLKAMDKCNVNKTVVSALLELKTSTVTELLRGNVSWKLKHIVKLSLYFNKSVDELLFGDKDYIANTSKKNMYEFKQDIKEYLIKEKKFHTLGKLEGNGYFNK